MPFSWFCRLAQDQGICEICFPPRRWRHCLLYPTMWTCGHQKSIYSNILTRCMSEWCFSLLSWNLKVVSLHYCVTSQLRFCAPISTTENIYVLLCICDIYVSCICEYFKKHSFVTSDLLLMLLSVQQFQAEKRWFDEKPQGHAPGNNTNTNYSQGCTNLCSLAAGLRGNEERMRKWRGNGEEMEREWGNGETISSFFLYILPLYPFPISKLVTFCRKMLNTAFLSRMSQKLNIRAMRK